MALASPYILPKMVALDRDGVINRDVGAPGVIRKEQFLLTPGAANAIGTLKRCGCHVVVVTNQSCVGKGLVSMLELEEIHDKMKSLLKEHDDSAVIDDIFICTSVDGKDPRKKPNPGMIIEACHAFQVDPKDTIFIGDTLTDLQAARSGGIQRRILVETGYGYGLMGNQSASIPPKVVENIDAGADGRIESSLSDVTPFLYASDLAEAVKSIVSNCDEI